MPSQADFAQSHLQFHSDLSHGCTHPTAEPEAPKDHPGSTLHQDWACPHYHSSSPCLALEAVHSYSTHSQDHYPSLEKGELPQKNSQLNKMTTKGSAASAPVATLTLEQRMPLDPEVRRPAPARGSVALDKGGSGENEGGVGSSWSRIWEGSGRPPGDPEKKAHRRSWETRMTGGHQELLTLRQRYSPFGDTASVF